MITRPILRAGITILPSTVFAGLVISLSRLSSLRVVVVAVVGVKELLRLVREEGLVEGLCERELTNPEGAGFDIRAGEVYKVGGKAFLGVTERFTPPHEKLAGIDAGDKSFSLAPGDFVLVKTMESFNLPADLTMHAFPRSTLHRSGLWLLATQTAPGYKGSLVFGLKNMGDCTVDIELGARVAHVQFNRVEGGGAAYRGQWQGGRVTSEAREKQV